ncbi:MAG TPA: FAD-dependent oxidoreductase, partial [Limnobacter sp.]|nr:FAD-dependent oxidoreductase [Limnobacter sp.]
RWIDRDVNPPLGFDHGTQYFQASTPAFVDLIGQARESGAVAPWHGLVVNLAYGVATPHPASTNRWVGTPGMASLGRFMAQDLDVRLQCRVASVGRSQGLYQLTLHQADGSVRVESGFHAVACAIPAEQVVPLFLEICPELATMASGVKSSVTWSVMLTPRESVKVNYDGAFVADSPLGWICRDSSKPGRASGERWVLQATADWSRLHQEYSPAEASKLLLDVFSNVTGQLLEDPISLTAHRWLYSLPVNPVGIQCYFNQRDLLGACGDWLTGARVEDAFSSGHALGHQLGNALLSNVQA